MSGSALAWTAAIVDLVIFALVITYNHDRPKPFDFDGWDNNLAKTTTREGDSR